MTNKQLYNLVFENFVQAKRELIREGYLRKNVDEVNFDQIFENTKKKMLEEKVKSLQRENEMLKSQLSKRKGLEEVRSNTSDNPSGYGETGGAGNEALWTFIGKIAAKFNISRTAILDVEIDKLLKSGTIDDITAKDIISKITLGINKGTITRGNIRNAINTLVPQTLSESKRRRRY
jgi:hypothetical protein